MFLASASTLGGDAESQKKRCGLRIGRGQRGELNGPVSHLVSLQAIIAVHDDTWFQPRRLRPSVPAGMPIDANLMPILLAIGKDPAVKTAVFGVDKL